MSRLNVPRAAPLAALLLLAACGQEGHGRGEITLTDSAGVLITTARKPLFKDGALRLAAEPTLQVPVESGGDGGADRAFVGALGIAGGGVVVADEASGRLRWYDGAGRLSRTLGDDGRFVRIAGLVRVIGDTVAVADPGSGRLTVVGPDGSVIREEPLPPSPGGPQIPFRFLWDDSILFHRIDTVADAGSVTGRERVHVSHRPAGGGAGTTFAALDGADVFQGMPVALERPFGRCSCLAPQLNGFAYGTGETPELVLYDTLGRMHRRLRWTANRRSVTARDVEGYRARQLAGARDPRMTAAVALAADYPERMPVYDLVTTWSHLVLWVRRYEPDPDADASWWVFWPEGGMEARVSVPARLRLLDADARHVVGVWRDAAGVETVRRYALVKER